MCFIEVIYFHCLFDEMFLRKSECQLFNIVKELQDVGLDIKDEGHPADYIGVNI